MHVYNFSGQNINDIYLILLPFQIIGENKKEDMVKRIQSGRRLSLKSLSHPNYESRKRLLGMLL